MDAYLDFLFAAILTGLLLVVLLLIVSLILAAIVGITHKDTP